MRVLLVHSRYRLPGGEERHVDLLEHGLQAAGVEVRRFDATAPRTSSVATRVRLAAGMVYRPSAAASIGRIIAAWRPDVVHAHNILPTLSPSVLHEAKRRQTAVVVTAHNFRFFCPSGTLLRRGRVHEDCVRGSSLLCGLRGARDSPLEGLLYGVAVEAHRRFGVWTRWVDSIVAPSAFLANMLARAGFPPDRIVHIPNAVELPTRADRNGADFALFAGRLSLEKGVRTLLAAAELAPGVPLVVAGHGPLASTVRASGAPRLSYIGHLPPEKLAAVRRRAAFVVAPSECYENAPYAVLEALADGVPVVASNIGGLPELVEDGRTGLLAAPGDADDLASAMVDLWSDRERARAFGQAARQTVEERFSLERQIGELERLYRHALGANLGE